MGMMRKRLRSVNVILAKKTTRAIRNKACQKTAMKYDPDLIATRVKEALSVNPDWSNRRWAEEIGISEGTIRNLKLGGKSSARSAKVETIYKLADATGFDVLYILGEMDNSREKAISDLEVQASKARSEIQQLTEALQSLRVLLPSKSE